MAEKRWGNEEDAKLLELFRTPHNSVDPKKLEKEVVKAVWRKYFPTGNYRNFAPLYRSKARNFNISRTLDGHRKRSAAAKAQHRQQAENIEDSDSSDSDYRSGEEEEQDIELDGDFLNEGQQEEEAMPSVTPKKRSSRKSRVAPTPEPAGEDIVTALSSMSLSGFKPFSMDYTFPFIISTFNDQFDVMCKVELYTHFLPKEFFNLETSNAGSVLEIRCQVPSIFPDETRVMRVNEGDATFTKNTHEAQSHKEVCESIDNHFPNSFHMGNPQRIALPFNCEERIDSWECQAYANDLVDHELGGIEEDGDEAFPEQQCHNILVVTLRKLRSKRKTSGGFRKVK